MGDITFIEGIEVALVAMSIVFLILVLMMLFLGLFVYVGKFEKKPEIQKAVSTVQNRTRVNLLDEDMVVACLVATIEASNEESCEFRVVNIKEIGSV